MKLVKPTFEIWNQGESIEGLWSHIARCTRVCYQSTPKNDGETDEEFVKRVILHSSTGELNFEKLHGAMLEHGTVYLYILTDDPIHWEDKYGTNPYSKIVSSYNTIRKAFDCYITTNLRVIYENEWLDDLKYLSSRTKYHKRRVTVCFTTNIGVTREFNRHRVNSIAEESTRYCDYTKSKFGNEVAFTAPAWFSQATFDMLNEEDPNEALCKLNKELGTEEEHEWEAIDYYSYALYVANYCYNNLRRLGWSPQKAREVLPLATKSQVIHTAFVKDWIHFFKLRAIGASGAPHPNAKLVAEPLFEEFVKRGYINYDSNSRKS